MKIQTIAKHISIQVLLFGTLGIVYAAWNDTVSTGDPLTAASWNEVVDRVEAFTVSGGNVGIGTNTPTAKLELDNYTGVALRVQSYDNSWPLMMHTPTGGIGGFYDPTGTGKGIWLYLDDGAGYKVKVTPDGDSFFNGGNVGIGTTTPTNKLEIGDAGHSGYAISTKTDTYGVNIQTASNVSSNAALWVQANVDAVAIPLLRVQNNGNVGIGTNTPTARLSVNGTANKSGGGTWAVFSDIRSKENIQDYTKGLNELLQLNPVIFKYKKEMNWGDTQVTGLIAQEVEKVVPSMVSDLGEVEGIENFKQLDPNELTYMLINAIKELKLENEKQAGEIKILQNK